MKKRPPSLKTDRQVESFLKRDLSSYLDADNLIPVTFEFAPKNATITVRLSTALLDSIKKVSKKKGIPYQRFIRKALEDSIKAA